METIKDIKDLKGKLERWGKGSVGLVHTKGPLHEGDLELIRAARKENFFVVVSNMVIQRECTDIEEYECYPRYTQEDERKAAAAGADFFFTPDIEVFEFMDSVISIKLKDSLKDELNGRGRSHYYEEQLTTLVKLFNLVRPQNFYMCEDDLQRVYFTRKVLSQLHYECGITVLPPARGEDQLLIDYRKERLKDDEKKQVAELAKIFTKAQTAYGKGMVSSRKIKWHVENELSDLYLCKIDFVEIVEPERLRKIETITDEAILMIGLKVGQIDVYDYVRLKKA